MSEETTYKTPPGWAIVAAGVRQWRVKVRYLDNPAGPLRGTETITQEDKPRKGDPGFGVFGRYYVKSVCRKERAS